MSRSVSVALNDVVENQGGLLDHLFSLLYSTISLAAIFRKGL